MRNSERRKPSSPVLELAKITKLVYNSVLLIIQFDWRLPQMRYINR